MQPIAERTVLEHYVQKFGLDLIFDDNVIRCMELQKFEKGELICSLGSGLTKMYFLVSGKVKIYSLLENGKSLLLRFIKPLNVIGDVEFLNQFEVLCNVESVCSSLLIAVKFEDIRRYAFDNPKFLRLIIHNLSGKLYRSSISHANNTLYTLEKRFASYLLSVSSDENNIPRENEFKTNKMTEIASFLGASYRHLNRVVNSLIAKKVLAKEKGVIIIIDFQKLKELSGGNGYE